MTRNPNDPLTAYSLKHYAAISALKGIIAHEGAPAKDNLDYKSVVENDVARAIDYADKLVERLRE
jgi:hypothetical protein